MNIFRDIRAQLIGMYILLAAMMSVGTFFSGKYVHGSAEGELLLVRNGLLAGVPVMLALVSVFTFIRLRAPRESAQSEQPAQDEEMRQWLRLTNFPKELAGCYLLVGMFIAQAHHLAVLGLPPWPAHIAFQYGQSTLANLTTFLALGMVHYCVARWILRPRIRTLCVYEQDAARFKSAGSDLIFLLGTGLAYLLLRILWYALNSASLGNEPRQAVLLTIWGTVFAITFIMIYIMSNYLFRDLRLMTEKLQALATMERGELRSLVAIGSPYESGELTAAFNMLQSRFKREYARLDNDLHLAFRVQQQLFLHHPRTWLDWQLQGTRGNSIEVGGSFYDVLPVSDQRLALTAGLVTGRGLPAALVTSALVMLLRTKIQEIASAGDLLTVLNIDLADIAQDSLRIHMAIAVIDERHGIIEYAAAGGATVLVEQPEAQLTATPCTEPLCSRLNYRYPTSQIPLSAKRCFIAIHTEGHCSLTAQRDGGRSA